MSSIVKSQSIKSQSIKSQPFKPQPFKSQPIKSPPINSCGIKARSAILAASTGIIAAVGAWYGAGLKKNQEKKQAVEARRQATTADKIAILEEARLALITKKNALETKIAEVEGRHYNAEGKKVMKPAQGRQLWN
ncbi:hypothetical protein N7G274_004506 [Stereocaulon virgatum]|uniref:Uncharacterized protein n=1 Tax=Stereocaulon virgatum TaxID=373712 RepID=A0ABR4AA41_9LECA